jgi:hypothetical protein
MAKKRTKAKKSKIKPMEKKTLDPLKTDKEDPIAEAEYIKVEGKIIEPEWDVIVDEDTDEI